MKKSTTIGVPEAEYPYHFRGVYRYHRGSNEWITEMDAIYIIITTLAVKFAAVGNSDLNKAVP